MDILIISSVEHDNDGYPDVMAVLTLFEVVLRVCIGMDVYLDIVLFRTISGEYPFSL